nr:MAG TPA: hypothetical protein [Caudoviricetes sp.]DAK90273.1 MAG TPA: hypothetical protein [Caudoviricetes sp.]DAZ24379.1 MAG TPA: hypothetical protein [Caudoviricetes sp.]
MSLGEPRKAQQQYLQYGIFSLSGFRTRDWRPELYGEQ